MNLKTKRRIRERLTDISFYGPALICYLLIMVLPTVLSFYYSMTNWDGLRKSISFIGLSNFKELLGNSVFKDTLLNTIVFAISYTILHNLVSIALALAFHRNTRRNTLVRSILFVPGILSPVIIAFIWGFIFEPVNGPMTMLAGLFGFKGTIQWLGDPTLAKICLIFTYVWANMGIGMVIYVAGIKGIDETYYEAAAIDGADKRAQNRHITLPLLAPSITVMVVYDTICSLKTFDLIYCMTSGGPGYATETVTLYVFREAFRNSRMGYGTAAGVVLFVIVLGVSLIQLKMLRSKEVQA